MRNRKIINQFYTLIGAIVLIMALSFLIIRSIVEKNNYQEDYKANEVVYDQLCGQIDEFEDQISSIFRRVAYNQPLKNILSTDDFVERSTYTRWFNTLNDDNKAIASGVRSTALYNLDGDMIMSSGDFFLSLYKITGNRTEPTYSTAKKNGLDTYFFVKLPVMDWNSPDVKNILGHLVLTIDTSEIRKVMNHSLVNSAHHYTFKDQNATPIYQTKVSDADAHAEFLTWNRRFSKSGYSLTASIDKNQLGKSLTQQKQVIYTTFILIFTILVIISTLIYRQVIGPIKRQISFMESYTNQPNQRIQVLEKNELGMLAEKMNDMLDDIQTLNQDVLRKEKAYLQGEVQRKHSELLALQSQINPHFLYNTFDCIRGMALYHDQRDIASMVQSLSNFFRYTIKGGELTSVEDEIRSIQQYATIINFRFDGRFTIDIKLQDDCKQVLIPKMLIQPLVENAIFHGMHNQTSGNVTIIIHSDKQRLKIHIKDNGEGIPPEKLIELKKNLQTFTLDNEQIPSKSIGITNVYRRLVLYYNGQATMDLKSSQEGTIIEIDIPIEEEGETTNAV